MPKAKGFQMNQQSDKPNFNLTINNIADAVKVFDFFAEQSSFKGWNNIRQIMALRDQLDAFVTAANAASTEQVQPAEQA